jgi:hypothetical protein
MLEDARGKLVRYQYEIALKKKNIFVLRGFRYGISVQQAGSCKHVLSQNRLCRASVEYYWKDFLIVRNFVEASKNITIQ